MSPGGSGGPAMTQQGAPQQSPYGISPTYLEQLLNMQSMMLNPSLVGNVPYISPTQFTGAVTSAMMPQFKQQDQALRGSLADAGIVGGSTTGAVGALGDQQQTQLAGQISPMIQQIMQGNQQTALNAGEFNANAANNMGQFDVGTIMNAGQFDANAFNQFLQTGMGFQNQDWLAQLGAMSGMFQGLGNAFDPIYQQPPDMSSLSGFGSLFGGGSSPSIPTMPIGMTFPGIG